MVNEIILNNTSIRVDKYKQKLENGLHKIVIEFKVTSEEYHDTAVLLYEGSFDVKVPETGLAFKGTIQQYSTSVTNLYEKGQVGIFALTLLEVKN
ncbi:DUF3219 family protein [Neobacillus sp. SAB-20_R2A]|uniref:DUF3219 family protein n=1 Tax=Neobacillus sp. SAB-20_R2A TaxID=3120519 RepID=UPI003C6E0F99